MGFWSSMTEINTADAIHVLQHLYDNMSPKINYRVKKMLVEPFQLYDVFSPKVIKYIESVDPSQLTDDESIKDWIRTMVKEGAIPANVKLTPLSEELLRRITEYPKRTPDREEKDEMYERIGAGATTDQIVTEYLIRPQSVAALRAWKTRRSS